MFSFPASCSLSLIVSYLSLFHVSTYFFFFNFRSVFCFFRTAKSWANICHYTLYFFPFPLKMEKLGQTVDFCKVKHAEGKREFCCRAEMETSHSFYCSWFFGAGLLMMLLGHFYDWCRWSNASFLEFLHELILLFPKRKCLSVSYPP